MNRSGVTRNYLEKEAPRIDARVASYLKENGFRVLPQREFEQHWNTAMRAFGNPVDPTSGKVNNKTFAQIMHSVRDLEGIVISIMAHSTIYNKEIDLETPTGTLTTTNTNSDPKFGGTDIFITKYASAGDVVWATSGTTTVIISRESSASTMGS